MTQIGRNEVADGRFVGLFVYSTGLILVVLAIAKVLMILDAVTISSQADPIFQMSFRSLLCVAALIELAVAGVCFFWQPVAHKISAIAWVGTLFLSYRLGLWWIGYEKPCACLGSLTGALGISPELADMIAKAILAYMLIGIYGLIVALWRRAKFSVGPNQPCV